MSLIKDLIHKLEKYYPERLTTKDLLSLGLFSESCWSKMRIEKRGPKYTKIFKNVFYKRDDVVAWLNKIEKSNLGNILKDDESVSQ